MTWLVRERPDLRCDYALNEASFRFELARRAHDLHARRRREDDDAGARRSRAASPGTRRCRRSGTTRCSSSRRCSSGSRALRAGAPRRRPSSTRCWTCWRPATAPSASASSGAALQHAELWHLLPALAGSTLVADDGARLAQAQRDARRGRASSATAACCPGTGAEELLGEFRAALAGLDVELELAEPPLGGTRSPLETPLRDALAEWVDELEPGALLVPGDQHGLHRLALHAGGLRDDRLRFLPIAPYGPGTRSTRFTRPTSASTCATSNSQCARSCTASTGSDRWCA